MDAIPMNEPLLKATLKVLTDGQALLYAFHLRAYAEIKDGIVSDEQFETWQDEWKTSTAALILEAINAAQEGQPHES